MIIPKFIEIKMKNYTSYMNSIENYYKMITSNFCGNYGFLIKKIHIKYIYF